MRMAALFVQDWGLISYQAALQKQLELVEQVHSQAKDETLVFCTHPPVVTLGRGTRPGDVNGWTGEIVEVGRGGRATYHGPSQLVVYPILDLNRRKRDLHLYMRQLEAAIVTTLREFGIECSGRSLQIAEGDEEAHEATGVWIRNRKVASIGIGVRKWITFHGLALNIERDQAAFRGLKPCGFTTDTMVSLEELVGKPVDREKIKLELQRHLLANLQTDAPSDVVHSINRPRELTDI